MIKIYEIKNLTNMPYKGVEVSVTKKRIYIRQWFATDEMKDVEYICSNNVTNAENLIDAVNYANGLFRGLIEEITDKNFKKK